MRRTLLVLASMAVVLVLASAAAFAVLTTAKGGPIDKVKIARETAGSFTKSTSFVDIPGASVRVGVPSGTTRLIMARYSAESTCYGASGWCSIRIVAVKPGTLRELEPASGGDFAFDSTNNNNEQSASWESHSMDRSARLAAPAHR